MPTPAGGLVPVSLEEAGAYLLQFASRNDTRFGTGWSIDDTCGQVGCGEMALMWARSGAGKSTWMLNIISNTPHVPTLVVNMEMTPWRQQEWLTAMTLDLSIPWNDIESVLREPEDPRYDETVRAVKTMFRQYSQVHFLNPSMPSVEDLECAVDDIADSTGVRPRRVFIDHLTLMGGADDYRGVTTTAAKLHSWAMRGDIALYVLQQTGRGTGEGERNNGHQAVTLNSGVYGGEADADWVYGLYRPDKNPKYSRGRHYFSEVTDYYELQAEYERVRGVVVLQVIKNRPFGDVNESGIELLYDPHCNKIREVGAH